MAGTATTFDARRARQLGHPSGLAGRIVARGLDRGNKGLITQGSVTQLPLDDGVLLTAYRDSFRLAGPDWVLRPALTILAGVGRRRGYRA